MGIVTQGPMHLGSGKVQILKISTGTQSPVPVLKVNRSAEEDDYRYSRLIEVQRKMSIGPGARD